MRAVDVSSELKFRRGATPAEGILAEAQEGAYDIVVVGGHGPKRRARFRLNDVTMQVVAGSDRPVLVVPAKAM